MASSSPSSIPAYCFGKVPFNAINYETLLPSTAYINTFILGINPYFRGADESPQSSLDTTLLQWEARVPKTDIWKAILIWADCEREKLERRKRDHDYKLLKSKVKFSELEINLNLFAPDYHDRRSKLELESERDIQAVERETRALETILLWVRHGGMEAFNSECVIDDHRVDMEHYIEQLLELMEQEYWRTQSPTSPCTDDDINTVMSVSSRKEIFRTMIREIPKVLKEHRRFGLGNSTLEARFSTTLDKILRLSSWLPSSTHNVHLHELFRNALLMLDGLGANDVYYDDLRNFMTRQAALCAFTLGNAIATRDSETTSNLCKELRRLAQNLGKIASTKAEEYQELYEKFIAYKGDLSQWLDSASPGQGRSLVDSFTDSLKDMASSIRQEANFWKSQSNQFNKWPDIRTTYGYAIDALPNDRKSLTTHGSVTQNAEPGPQRVAQAAQRVSATSADLHKLRVNTTQEFLVKSENSISKRMGETRGYLESVVDAAEEQLSQPSEECVPKVMVRLAEKALCIAKRWNKLQRKVKYWGGFLSMFSKPCQTLPKFDIISGISQEDFFYRLIATPDTLFHPYLIEFEICLRNMGDHFLSRAHFWTRISDPATFSTVSLS